MATSIGHALAGYALGATAGPTTAGRRFRIACAAAAAMPDLDVMLRLLGKSTYTALGGHRGITHSIFFAVVVAAGVAALPFPLARRHPVRTWLAFACAIVSHPLLDMLTSYGHGVALFAPFSWRLVSFPWHPIDPDTAARAAGSAWSQLALAFGNEMLWVWLPALLLVVVVGRLRRSTRQTSDQTMA